MADKHPYFNNPTDFVKLITHLRRTFPPSVTADTIKKLQLAPKNESYLIGVLRFLDLIDAEGNKTELAGEVFYISKDEDFQAQFAQVVEKAYPELFILHGPQTWDLDKDSLIAFFRQNDKSSDPVGKAQASTFKCLAALSGHGEVSEPTKRKRETPPKRTGTRKGRDAAKKAPKAAPTTLQPLPAADAGTRSKMDFGLTVRIEINLPAGGDQETYDRIFKSIRENLLNG